MMDWEQELLQQQKQADAYNEAWRAKWPNHCRKCGGWGGFSFTQRHDSGPGEQMFDLCEAVEDPCICHRCGEPGLDSDGNGPCTKCGWNYDDGLQEVM